MAGFGGGLGFDASAAAGLLGGLGGLGGPWGGAGGYTPYIPVTPLGALESYKGDLIYPIVAVGVALFILLIIVLAVKAALAWKLSLLDDLTGRARRDVTSNANAIPPSQNDEQMNWLTKTIMTALENENCSQKVVCLMGSYAKGTSVPSYMTWLESYMAEDYRDSFDLFKKSAEGTLDCSRYKCGGLSSKIPTFTSQTNNTVPTTQQFLDPNNTNSKIPQKNNNSQQQQSGFQKTTTDSTNANAIEQ